MSQAAGTTTSVRRYECEFTARRGNDGPEADFTVALEQTLEPGTASNDLEQTVEDWVRQNLHGKVLKDVLGTYPSVEHVALYTFRGCADLVPGLSAVQLSPKDGTWITYRP